MTDDTKLARIGPNEPGAENVEITLHQAVERVRNSNGRFRKAIVVLLDDQGDAYSIAWYNAGLRMSETVALCETVKSSALDAMGY